MSFSRLVDIPSTPLLVFDGSLSITLTTSSSPISLKLNSCSVGFTFFVHGFLSDSMLSTVFVPIVKDKTGRIDRMDNYRPIALASVISKVVEIILLNRISKLYLFESVRISAETGYRHLYLHSERACGKV